MWNLIFTCKIWNITLSSVSFNAKLCTYTVTPFYSERDGEIPALQPELHYPHNEPVKQNMSSELRQWSHMPVLWPWFMQFGLQRNTNLDIVCILVQTFWEWVALYLVDAFSIGFIPQAVISDIIND